MTPFEIETATALTWPAAKEVDVAGWRVFLGAGHVGRTNSCWPLTFSGDDVDQAILDVEALYRANNLVPQFKIAEAICAPRDLKERLLQRGYVVKNETAVMTSTTDFAPPSHKVSLQAQAIDRFISVITETSPNQMDGDERAQILARVPSASAFGHIALDGDVVAVGVAVFAGMSAGIASMRTKQPYRQRGLARSVLRAVARQARSAGAQTLWLQVETDNFPAINLYKSEGFELAYSYTTLRSAT
jgi:N-acetylglutamate synthase